MSRFSLVSKVFAGVGFAAAATTVRVVLAEPPPPVDVVIPEPPPPRRILAIEWSPLALTIGRISADLVIVPVDHHALTLSPFYASTTTAPIYVVDTSGGLQPGTRLPKQKFESFGGEIGYRYYTGRGGPRGFFAGPSVLFESVTATAEDGSKTPFFDYGLAADLGYEALVAERVALTLGGGVQYTIISKSIPDQQMPAAIYANSAVRPRLLLAVGYAF
jgi:hypothetical protein